MKSDNRYNSIRKSYLRYFYILSFFILCITPFSTGCAPTPEKVKIDLVWPLPPDQPRIRFVDEIRNSLDLGKHPGMAEVLFGEEQIERFSKPYGVAVDKEGRIYITDIGKVVVYDLKKKDYSYIGRDPGVGQLRVPIGIAVARDGRVLVTDLYSARVFVYANGKYLTAIGAGGELLSPSGVALDEKRGLIYIVDSKKHFVSVYSLTDYSRIRTLGKGGFAQGEFNYPTNIAVDPDGRVYVADTGNFRIQIFDAAGNFIKSIGKLGDTPGSLARPKGVALDSEGHIYVVDTAFQNFQIFDQEGKILLFVGQAGVGPGSFLLPAGIAIDDEDKIYVIDQIPGSVQIFQYLGGKEKKREQSPGASGEKKG